MDNCAKPFLLQMIASPEVLIAILTSSDVKVCDEGTVFAMVHYWLEQFKGVWTEDHRREIVKSSLVSVSDLTA